MKKTSNLNSTNKYVWVCMFTMQKILSIYQNNNLNDSDFMLQLNRLFLFLLLILLHNDNTAYKSLREQSVFPFRSIKTVV